MKQDADDRRLATEDRLRAALAARAALVTHRDLRPEEPPQGRGWSVRRVRGVALAGLGVAAAVVAIYLTALLPGGPREPAPVPPARTPGITEPSAATPEVEVRPGEQGSAPGGQGSPPDERGSVPDERGSVPDEQGSVPSEEGPIPSGQGVPPTGRP
ncbi:hypothetical protein ACFWAA_17195 [Streptomyces sp. NPDC059922]|uniref:hypothetical protein n=1 Tax=Streptomyces sp. NPDC059922 TaxID=3347005 RepID=UPI00365A940D